MSVATEPAEQEQERIAEFVRAVRGELSDLPALTVDELVGGLVADLAATVADTDRPVGELLRDPGGYAEELRAGAGLPPRGRRAPRFRIPLPSAPSLLVERAASWAGEGHPARTATVSFLRAILPVWWVARGLALAAGVNLVLNTYGLGLWLVALVAIVFSVQAGRRKLSLGPSRSQRLDRGLDIAGVVLGVISGLFFGLLFNSLDRQPPVITEYVQSDVSAPSGNYFVYDASGALVPDARIVDGDGTLLDFGASTGYTEPDGTYTETVPYDGPVGESYGVFPLDVRMWSDDGTERRRPALVPHESLPPLYSSPAAQPPSAPTTPPISPPPLPSSGS